MKIPQSIDPSMLTKLQLSSIKYDESTLAMEKLYATLFSMEQPFYYQKGCFFEGSMEIDLCDLPERYDLAMGESIYHNMLLEMGQCKGCSYKEGYLSQEDLTVLESKVKEIGLKKVIDKVFFGELPDFILDDQDFCDLVLYDHVSDRSDMLQTFYLIISSQRSLDETLCSSMQHLLYDVFSVHHFIGDNTHYFIYFLGVSSYNYTDYTSVNAGAILAWMKAHTEEGGHDPYERFSS